MNRFSFTFSRLIGVTAALSALTLVIVTPLSAQAAKIKTFTSRAAWEATTPGGMIFDENFDVSDTDNADSLTFPTLPFVSADGTPDSANRRLRIRNGRLRLSIDDTAGNNTFDAIKIIFDQPVLGFGANFFNVDPGLTISSDTFDNDVNVYQTLLSDASTIDGVAGLRNFFGIVSHEPFTEFTFSSATPNFFSIDDFSADVPTPALLPGLVGMGVAAFRKRSKAEASEENA